MKTHFYTFVPALALIVALCATCTKSDGMEHSVQAQRIRLTFEGKEVVVEIQDHPTNREFLSRLPMTLEFSDYIGVEKIAYLPSKLSTGAGSPLASGDFAYYAPWGNLAVFYNRNGTSGGGLIVLGRIISGKENLREMTADFTATIEIIQ